MDSYLIYGATGYTGTLIARLAVERGHTPILAGRDPLRIPDLAEELGLEYRIFQLKDQPIVEQGVEGVPLVLHCAGPFHHTYRVMSDACLEKGAHYLDITGEPGVIESLAGTDDDAREKGLMVMPGVGFDVVPTDCLALHLKRRLPSASRLTLAIRALGQVSRGTATTMLEGLPRGGLVRRGGRLKTVPAAFRSRMIDFGDSTAMTTTVPWGDLASAYRSTGIPDIEVYMALPGLQRSFVLATRFLAPVVGFGPVQAFLKGRIKSGRPGPSEQQRSRGRSLIWGEVVDREGRRAISRLATPDGYTLTTHSALAIVERVLGGEHPAGFQTPAMAYGSDLVMELEGVQRWDVAPEEDRSVPPR